MDSELKEVLDALKDDIWSIKEDKERLIVEFKGSFSILTHFLNMAGYKWDIDYDLESLLTVFKVQLK